MSDLTTRIADVIRPYMDEVTETTLVAAAVVSEIHPTITSVEALDALPEETVVRSEQGGIFVHIGGGLFFEPGVKARMLACDIALPAVVLWQPEVGA